MNPYVFIVGCPRSGTTLLRHIVMAHPQITITPEPHWIPVWFEERSGLRLEDTSRIRARAVGEVEPEASR